MLKPSFEIRDVTGISDAQRKAICDFLQGAVYCWCKNRPNEWFSLRDLMGRENCLWHGTPLIVLSDKYSGRAADPLTAGAIDGGHLLKKVIHDDRRTFETNTMKSPRHYRWNGDDRIGE